MNAHAEYWISHLQLTRHVEGGWFKETYRSPLNVQLPQHVSRAISTSIYFLLEKDDFSAFHRIASDEQWHFYSGDGLVIYEFDQGGELIEHHLGPDPANGDHFQITVKKGHWFASRVKPGGVYSLAGCTVAPGFEYADFELARRDELTQQYPNHIDLIKSLTRT